MEQRFREQRPDVPAAQAVDDALTLSLSVDEAGEAQFRQVLARDGGSAFGDGGEAGDVEFGVAQRPEHPYSRRVSEQRERGDGGVDLGWSRVRGVAGGRGVVGAR
jgi:hypothetical protein